MIDSNLKVLQPMHSLKKLIGNLESCKHTQAAHMLSVQYLNEQIPKENSLAEFLEAGGKNPSIVSTNVKPKK